MPPNPLDDRGFEESQPTPRTRRQLLASGARGLLAWATESRLRVVLLAGACLMSVAGGVLAWLAIAWQHPSGPLVTSDMVLEALDNGAYVKASKLAKKLKEQGTLSMEELGGPAFALGAAAAYEAEGSWSKDRAKHYLAAARYLEEARDRGFPPGRRGEGLYLLGKSLYLSGQIPASRPVLLAALKVNRPKRTEIHGLLSGAYQNDANPQLEKALEQNTRYLSDRRLPGADRHEGLLQRAQILLRMDKIAACVAVLDKIPSDARNRADAVVMRGRVLMHEARALKNKPGAAAADLLQAKQKYQSAIKTLLYAQGRDTLGTQATRKAMYLIGICYREIGDYPAALGQFARIGKRYADLPEGLAASFQQAELSRQLGRDAEALTSYRRVLGAIPGPENFSNPWVTLDQLRSRMQDAYQHYLNTHNFEIALQLTQHFYPLFSRARTLELTAEAHRSWGRALGDQADHMAPGRADPLRHLGRAQLRRAGHLYSRLAGLQVATRQYPDQLWNSATTYLDGQDYRSAVRVLEEYLKNESRRRHPQALIHLGEAMLALNQVDKALEALQECIQFYPRDVAAFRARLLASKAYLEKGDLPQAEVLLKENLNGELLTPDSTEWRDSLYMLGDLLSIQGRYEEAIERLEYVALEYVANGRFPDDAQAMNARYLVADAYRQSAKDAQEKLKQDLPGATRVTYFKRIRELFDKALEKYEQLRDLLSRRQETTELVPREKAMLQNCYFAIGDVLFDLGQYDAAIQAYSNATNRYQNQPAVLLAYVQIANAYRHLNKTPEARATLEQAKGVLSRIKTDSPFDETTNYNRQEWSELLDSLSKL